MHEKKLPDPTSIVIAYGDGVGPEMMEAVLPIWREAGANLTIDTIEIGERIYQQGGESGILPSAWEVLERHRILLKGPINRPLKSEFKSLHDTLMSRFDLKKEYTTQLPTRIDYADSLVGRAQIGEDFALFEPVHGAMEDQAGQGIADPSGMLNAGVLLLNHIGQTEVSDRVYRAWLGALDAGFKVGKSQGGDDKTPLTTQEFAEAIMARLWQKHSD